jgi:Tol biopolymer transport system component/predicted Ser/Thr protein kinase
MRERFTAVGLGHRFGYALVRNVKPEDELGEEGGDTWNPEGLSPSEALLKEAARAPAIAPPSAVAQLVGRTLGRYRIDGIIGRGGMGTVLRATDPALAREVALKVLPVETFRDEERRARFLQEARLAALVMHPNIAAIYEVGEDAGFMFIAMELVRGQTLRAWMKRDRAMTEVLLVAIEILRGLSRAHDRGVVHRDLKPENVMISDDGDVKLLDFGIAKRRAPEPEHREEGPATQEGVLLGTPGYISPEATEGELANAKSDVFAFGAILYEMLTKARAFAGKTTAETIHATIHTDPVQPQRLNKEVSAELDALVMRCLAKDPEKRFASARDVGEALKRVAAAKSRSPQKIILAIAVIVLAGLALGLWIARSTSHPETPTIALVQLTDRPGEELMPALAPDGRVVAYVSNAAGKLDIYLLEIGGDHPINLTDGSKSDNFEPAFSPDGSEIAFVSTRDGGGIFIMGALGDSPRRAAAAGFRPAWSLDKKTIYFASSDFSTPYAVNTSDIMSVDLGSGQVHRLIKGHFGNQPAISPHSLRLAYWAVRKETTHRDLFTARLDGTDERLATDDAALDYNPIWSEDGRALYFLSDRAGAINLFSIAIDEHTGVVQGAPIALTSGTGAMTDVSAVRSGRLVYSTFSSSFGIEKLAIDPATRHVVGSPTIVVESTKLIGGPEVSPDGQTLIYREGPPLDGLVRIGTDGTGRQTLTPSGVKERFPAFSPDGSEIAVQTTRGGHQWSIWRVKVDGTGAEPVTHPKPSTFDMSPLWSPDGRSILFARSSPNLEAMIAGVSDGSEQPLVALADDNCIFGSWSRDGDRLIGTTYGAQGSGNLTMYTLSSKKFDILPLPSEESGDPPRWMSDGRHIVITFEKKVGIYDLATKSVEMMFELPAGQRTGGVSLTRDDRLLYLGFSHREADLWMAEIKTAARPLR